MARRSERVVPPATAPHAAATAVEDEDRTPSIDGIHINLRLLALTVVLGAAAAALVYFQHGLSVRRNADSYLKAADEAESRGDTAAAIEGLTRYLQFRSTAVADDDDETVTKALVRLSNLLEQGGITPENARHVFSIYESALRRDPTNQQVRRKAVDLCMEIGRFRDAVLHIDYLRKAAAGSDTTGAAATAEWAPAELALIAGLAHSRLSEFEEAQLEYLRAINEDPDDPLPYTRLATVVAARPQNLCEQSQLKEIEGPLAAELKELFPESSGPSELATFAAIGLHRLAVTHAQPAWMAWRNAAEFLMATVSPDDRVAAPKSLADQLAGDAVRALDRDMDGRLSIAESHSAQVPACADSDFDGVITPAELSGYFEAGDRWGRLMGARNALVQAAEHVPPENNEARGAVLVSQIALDLLLSSTALAEQRPEGPEFLTSAQRAAEDGLKLNLGWPEFLDGLAQVDQQMAAAEAPGSRNEHLDAAEKHLRDAIASISTAKEDGAKRDDEDERLRGGRRVFEADLLWRLAELLSQRTGGMAASEAEKVQEEVRTDILPRMEELGVQPVYSDLVKARLLILGRQWREAADKLARLERQMNATTIMHHEIQLQRAFCAEKLGNPDAQVELARSAVTDNPRSATAHQLLGQGLWRLGRIDEAVRELQLGSAARGGAELLGGALLRQQQLKPARERNWDQVEQVVSAIEQRPDGGTAAVKLRAELAFAQAIASQQEYMATEDPAAASAATAKILQAQQLLEEKLEQAPQDVDLRVALISHFLRRFDKPEPERFERCEGLLRQAPPAVADSPDLKLAAAAVAHLLPKEEALPWLEEIEASAAGSSKQDQYQLHAALAKSYFGFGETDRSLKSWATAAKLFPSEVEPLLAQLQVLLLQAESTKGEFSGQQERAWSNLIAAVEGVEGPGGPNSSFFAAAKEILQFVGRQSGSGDRGNASKELVRPRELLERVARERPSWPAPQRFLAQIQALAGNTEGAVLYLEKAVYLGDRSESVIAQLANYYVSHGRKEDADRVTSLLDASAVESLSDPAAQLALRVADQNQQYDRAIELLRGIGRRGPTADSAVLLAVMMFRKDPADPEVETKSREAAYEKWPQSPATWQWLVRYYAAMGRFDDAKQAIRDAEGRIEPEPAWRLSTTLGSCYELLATADSANAQTHLEAAEKYFQKALEQDPNAGRMALADFYVRHNLRDKALQALRALLDPKADVSTDIRFRAQLQEALVIASTAQPADTSSALKQLERLRPASDVANIELLRAKVAVYISRNQAGDRKSLIAALESLRRLLGERLGERERLQLAALYEAEGRAADAEQTYRALLKESNAESAQGLASLLALLIRRGKESPQALDEASSLLGRLRKIEPDTLRSVSASARLLAAQGRLEVASDELVGFARRRAQEHQSAGARSDTGDVSDPQVLLSALQSSPELQNDRIVRALLQRAEYSLKRGEDQQALDLLKQIDAAKQMTDELRLEAVRVAAQTIEGFVTPVKDPQDDTTVAVLKSAEDLYRLYAASTSRPAARLVVPVFLARHDRVDESLAECEALVGSVPVEQIGAVAMTVLHLRPERIKEQGPPWAARVAEALKENDPERQYKQYLLLGDFYVMLEKYSEATQVYAQVLKLKEDDLVALNNLAWLYGRLGTNLDEALRYVQTVIEKYGAVPELVDTQAVVLIAMGRNDMALAALQGLADQNAPKVQLRKAEVYWRMGREAEARTSAQKALQAGLKRGELDPFDKAILEALEAGSPLVRG